jgi:hypothetical protein
MMSLADIHTFADGGIFRPVLGNGWKCSLRLRRLQVWDGQIGHWLTFAVCQLPFSTHGNEEVVDFYK